MWLRKKRQDHDDDDDVDNGFAGSVQETDSLSFSFKKRLEPVVFATLRAKQRIDLFQEIGYNAQELNPSVASALIKILDRVGQKLSHEVITPGVEALIALLRANNLAEREYLPLLPFLGLKMGQAAADRLLASTNRNQIEAFSKLSLLWLEILAIITGTEKKTFREVLTKRSTIDFIFGLHKFLTETPILSASQSAKFEELLASTCANIAQERHGADLLETEESTLSFMLGHSIAPETRKEILTTLSRLHLEGSQDRLAFELLRFLNLTSHHQNEPEESFLLGLSLLSILDMQDLCKAGNLFVAEFADTSLVWPSNETELMTNLLTPSTKEIIQKNGVLHILPHMVRLHEMKWRHEPELVEETMVKLFCCIQRVSEILELPPSFIEVLNRVVLETEFSSMSSTVKVDISIQILQSFIQNKVRCDASNFDVTLDLLFQFVQEKGFQQNVFAFFIKLSQNFPEVIEKKLAWKFFDLLQKDFPMFKPILPMVMDEARWFSTLQKADLFSLLPAALNEKSFLELLIQMSLAKCIEQESRERLVNIAVDHCSSSPSIAWTLALIAYGLHSDFDQVPRSCASLLQKISPEIMLAAFKEPSDATRPFGSFRIQDVVFKLVPWVHKSGASLYFPGLLQGLSAIISERLDDHENFEEIADSVLSITYDSVKDEDISFIVDLVPSFLGSDKLLELLCKTMLKHHRNLEMSSVTRNLEHFPKCVAIFASKNKLQGLECISSFLAIISPHAGLNPFRKRVVLEFVTAMERVLQNGSKGTRPSLLLLIEVCKDFAKTSSSKLILRKLIPSLLESTGIQDATLELIGKVTVVTADDLRKRREQIRLSAFPAGLVSNERLIFLRQNLSTKPDSISHVDDEFVSQNMSSANLRDTRRRASDAAREKLRMLKRKNQKHHRDVIMNQVAQNPFFWTTKDLGMKEEKIREYFDANIKLRGAV